MNNWRLLLLAVVVVVQPIGSFTESNLLDGRKCCERSDDARFYENRKTEERRSLDVNREDHRINEQLRLRTLDRIRNERRYETTHSPMLTRSESLERSERRIIPELSRSNEHRLIREQEHRHRDTLSLNREARGDLTRKQDESRNILDKNERDSLRTKNRYASDTARISSNAKDTTSVELESRNSVSRLPIRNSRSIEERRISPNRESVIIKRELKDIARSDTRHDSRLTTSESNIHLDENRDRRVFERRITEDGTEYRQSRFSDARINDVNREVRVQRSVEQNRNNHGSREVRIVLRSHQRDMEMRDSVNAVRRGSMMSADRMRVSRDENTRQNRDENRRSIDSLRITPERRLDTYQTRFSRSSDFTTRNAEPMERRPVSMNRLMLRESQDSRLLSTSERNTRDERISRDGTHEIHTLRRITSRNDIREYSEERRQQREVRDDIEHRQESRVTDTRNDARESSEELRQQREVSRFSAFRGSPDTKRMQVTQRIIKDSSEERLRREKNRLSRESSQEVRGNTGLEQRRNSRTSSEFRQDRETIRLSSRRYGMGNERSDLRRQVLERSMERSHMTRSTSAERNNARETTRASRSVETITREDTKSNERDERRQTRDQERSIEKQNEASTLPQQLDAQRLSRTENFSIERVVRNRDIRGNNQARVERTTVQRETRNLGTPLRLDVRSTSRPESTSLERLVRVRADTRENERRDMQCQQRDGERTRILSNRRSSERMFAQRSLEKRDSPKDFRKVQRNPVEERSERDLSERRQEIRDAIRDSRNIRGEIRSDSAIAGRRQENRESRNVREIRMNNNIEYRRRRDSTRDSRGKSLHRESRDVMERLTERSHKTAAGTEVRRGSRSDIRTHKVLTMERIDRRDNSFTNIIKREETRFRNIDDMTRDTLVEDSDKPVLSNWPTVFYTLQGVYLFGLLVQMLTENANKTKKRTFHWWSIPKNLIKMD